MLDCSISRRSFSCALIAAAASAGESRRIPVALQLFSVRKQCEENLAATLARVKGIGFNGVEFAGYYNHGPAELRRMLDHQGLLCCGAHVPIALLLDRFDSTVEFHRALGNRILIVPGLPASYKQSIDGWMEAARMFETLSTKLASAGLILGYHNHAVEFGLIDGKRVFDVFFQH
ncbi:MAG: Sugar phosphate isomerase/epimerase, partial [Bryobacterales bacterium]|nr:Sugar phosphate isomerase/epimerase [Bryobacterales bacterium]